MHHGDWSFREHLPLYCNVASGSCLCVLMWLNVRSMQLHGAGFSVHVHIRWSPLTFKQSSAASREVCRTENTG